MTLLALELIDSRVLLARRAAAGAELVAESPGCIVIDGDALVIGEAAQRRARLRPLLTCNRFWREITIDPLPRGNALARTAADLAYAHARTLLQPHLVDGAGLLLALPAGYSSQQLGLLLGVFQAAGAPVAGVVDVALAAVAGGPVSERVLHLELELHQATLTLIERDAWLRRGPVAFLPRHGLLALQQVWVEAVAAEFVRRTRFDPLHDARNEQALWNGMAGWLDALGRDAVTEVGFESGPASYRVELAREAILGAARPVYARLCEFVLYQCPVGVRTELVIPERVAVLPGLAEQLAALPDLTVRTLPSGAAATNALRIEGAIRRPPGALTLVTRLPAGADDAVAAGIQATAAVTPEHERPTHLLFEGRAVAITAEPLVIGCGAPVGQRSLQVPAGAGISRIHCGVQMRADRAWLEDRSTYGTLVNGRPVQGAAELRVGDRIRLGRPGVILDLIRIDSDGPAP